MSQLEIDWTDYERRSIAGISGGRTSGRMAFMVRAILCFQNTSEEHAKTYDFVDRLEQELGRQIYRLEFRAPPRGEPPIKATFEIVEHRHLQRKGEVFDDMLEMCLSYRAKHKGLGPVAPWARSRICTAYMKVRTQRKFCEWIGWGGPTEYTEYVGLRADEPKRVAKMRARNADRDTDERAPLADIGIVKADVMQFWSSMPFDLGLEERDGNCKNCFLKDEADLAENMLEDPETADRWISREEKYGPMRRGGRPSYRQVRDEAPTRMAIRGIVRDALIEGRDLDARELAEQFSKSPRRVKLLIAQERKIAELGPDPFSCECDAAKGEELDELMDVA